MPLVAGGATNTKVKFKIKKKRDLLACPAVQFILLALIRMMYLGRIGCSCIKQGKVNEKNKWEFGCEFLDQETLGDV
jgi:hypothetical protein